ncbi:hypothetical protein A5722_05995 [Mycobacterium vulneris]|nr:hypothetical protein A5722_05995 [Mycolicibacterium vulneris]OCB60692.1 hypothetical protein A5729_32815 [Mycolicibacterium vulneris]
MDPLRSVVPLPQTQSMYPDFVDLKPRGLAGASARVSELDVTAKGAAMESKGIHAGTGSPT